MTVGGIGGEEAPLVSIVTPSFNMAPFIELAIESVLSQDYSNIEYIVMDGGSTDGTLEILRKYEGRLQYESRPDKGQTDAINRGFRLSRGRIFAFLCADDAYLPGAVGKAVRKMMANPGHAGVYGEGYLVGEEGRVVRPYPTRAWDPELLKTECFICQPASFLWRQAFEEVGMMNPALHYSLDYDLWIRLARRHSLLKVDDFFAVSRVLRGSKTLRQRRKVYGDMIEVCKAHFGYAPYAFIYGYCCTLLDKRDGFFEPVPASLAKYLLSLAYGSYANAQHLSRFWKDWLLEGVEALRRKAWP